MFFRSFYQILLIILILLNPLSTIGPGIVGTYAETKKDIDTQAAINKLAADALNNFVGISQSFIDFARKDELVEDSIRLHNEMSEPIDYQCDFLNDDKRTPLEAGQIAETKKERKYGEGYWTCCKFIRTKTNQLIPKHSHIFDGYLGLDLIQRGGKVRNIYVRDNGITVHLPLGEDPFDSRATPMDRHLAGWDWKSGYQSCPHPTKDIIPINEKELVVQLTVLIIKISEILARKEQEPSSPSNVIPFNGNTNGNGGNIGSINSNIGNFNNNGGKFNSNNNGVNFVNNNINGGFNPNGPNFNPGGNFYNVPNNLNNFGGNFNAKGPNYNNPLINPNYNRLSVNNGNFNIPRGNFNPNFNNANGPFYNVGNRDSGNGGNPLFPRPNYFYGKGQGPAQNVFVPSNQDFNGKKQLSLPTIIGLSVTSTTVRTTTSRAKTTTSKSASVTGKTTTTSIPTPTQNSTTSFPIEDGTLSMSTSTPKGIEEDPQTPPPPVDFFDYL